MHRRLVQVIGAALSLVVGLPLTASAQEYGSPTQQWQPGQQVLLNSPAQLDQLLAPIALYPDQLLGQILMASTYPMEVVQANRWVRDPRNAGLRGDQLAGAIERIDWDPSVKSLVPFPQILALMDERLDWTQNLGDAFLAQQADVMDSVQRLRYQAQSAGTLQSTPQQTVVYVDRAIAIRPASPTVVYVPVYNPNVVYGAWRYPSYPPYYFPPPRGLYLGPAIVSGIGFSIGFGIVRLLWGWDDWDWTHRRIHVDATRYNVINNYFIRNDHRPAIKNSDWSHDSYHRRGVVYRAPQLQAATRYAPNGRPEARRDFRGFEANAPTRPSARPAPARPNAQRPSADTHAPTASAPRQQAPRPTATTQRPAAVARPAPNPAPAFQSFAKGADVRIRAERGRVSRLQPTPKAAAKATPKPEANALPTADNAPRTTQRPVAARAVGKRPSSNAGKEGDDKPDSKDRRQQR
jgi:Protein of unknown function (DUF3300)